MRQYARIIAHSVAPTGVEIITYEFGLWRPLLAEWNTHRVLSRSAASSRAVPAHKRRKQVMQDPWTPTLWGRNQKGMQAGSEIDRPELADLVWQTLGAVNVFGGWLLDKLGAHKTFSNRVIEPWHTVPVVWTATVGPEFENVFALRCERDENGEPYADYHMAEICDEALRQYQKSVPTPIGWKQWHLPYLTPQEFKAIDWDQPGSVEKGIIRSVACCGRVSYENHDGTKPDGKKDRERHDSFLKLGHMGPLEHQAQPALENIRSGNFTGWTQYRKNIPNECRRFDLKKRYDWLYPDDIFTYDVMDIPERK